MSKKYQGIIETLNDTLELAGITGEWKSDGSGKQTFRSEEGGIFNWWPNGTVNFQGSPEAKAILEQKVNSLLSDPSNSSPVRVDQNVSETTTVNKPQTRLLKNREGSSSLLKRTTDALANSGLTVMFVNDSSYIVRESDYDHFCSLVESGSEIYIREL